MELLQTVGALVVTLGILVTVHEYGHFIVARRCGVKVLRFSVGFGRPLCSWHDKSGTEYVIAALPLGGYVKMLDEREGDVPAELADQAFNRQTVHKRIAIAAAGPLANFLFAIVAYWLMFTIGVTTVKPVIGDVREGSPAALAGLAAGQEIVAIDQDEVPDWQAVNISLLSYIGESTRMTVDARQSGGDLVRSYQLQVDDWGSVDEDLNPLMALGITPYQLFVPAVIGEVLADGAAAGAGIQAGDRIVEVNDLPVTDWMAFVDIIRESADRQLEVGFERDGRLQRVILSPERFTLESGEQVGRIGAAVEPPEWDESMLREVRYPFWSAWQPALKETGTMTLMTLGAIKKMVEGLISYRNLSGPITIAKVAGSSVRSGLESFIAFLAYLSISLGVLNLLPIPVLDGGHLLFYFIELVRGKPVSEEKQLIGLKIGITIIGLLMILALYNDLSRL